MRKIIHRVSAAYLSTLEGQQALKEIYHLKQQPGWRKYQAMLLLFGNEIGNRLLDADFQKKSSEEKVLLLEVYSQLSDFIKFAIDPTKKFEEIGKLKQHNLKTMKGKAHG